MKKITYKQLFDHACLEIKEITGEDLSIYMPDAIEIIQYEDGGEAYNVDLLFKLVIQKVLRDNRLDTNSHWLSAITVAFLKEIKVFKCLCRVITGSIFELQEFC